MNPHPAIVHFPIALLVASFAFDLLGFVAKSDSLRLSGRYCLILAVIGAAAGYWSGLQAAVEARGIPEIGDYLTAHRNAGAVTLLLGAALLVVRIVVIVLYKPNRLAMIVYLFVALVAVVSVLRAGYTGAELVQRFGAGVEPVQRSIQMRQSQQEQPASTPPPASPAR